MAGRAGDRAVGRQALVVEQALTERALCFRKGIRCGKRDRGWPAERGLQGRKIRLLPGAFAAERMGAEPEHGARRRTGEKCHRNEAWRGPERRSHALTSTCRRRV